MSGNIPDLECLAARVAANMTCCDRSLMYDNDIQLGRILTIHEQFLEEPQSFISPDGNGLGLELVTLSFGLNIDIVGEEEDTARWAAPLADLKWFQGGTAEFTATIDVANGTMLTLLARGVTVALRVPAPSPDLEVDGEPIEVLPFEQISISGAVAWGTRASRGIVTRTFSPIPIAAAAASAFIEIPHFAYALDMFATLGASTFTVRFFSGPAGQAYQMSAELGTAYVAGRSGEGVKFPPDAKFIEITNTGAARESFIPSFRLAL